MHHTTKYPPFKLVFGKEPRLSIDLLEGTPLRIPKVVTPGDWAIRMAEQLRLVYQVTKKSTLRAKLKQAKYYDARHRPVQYSLGQLVWL